MLTFAIEKTFGGYRVRSEPPARESRKSFVGADENRAFSRAVGYAATWAAETGVEMQDRTGRLSADQCRMAVDEIRSAVVQVRT